MKYLMLLFAFIFTSCSKQEDTKIEGVKMGMAYMILIREKVEYDDIPKIQAIVNNAFNEVNNKLNSWNCNSEISAWNNTKSTEKIKVSPLLLEVVNLADKVHTLTNGRFDPSLGRIIYKWKRCLKLGKSLTNSEILSLAPAAGWDKVIIHKDSLQKTHPDVSLDLDGITKGFLCDLIKKNLQKYGLKNFLVEWAGEIQTCGGPFKILSGDKIITLTDKAIATSGTFFRLYTISKDNNTTFYSHFIDPQTLEPTAVTPYSSSKSIVHQSCAIADGLATSTYIPQKEISTSTSLEDTDY